MNDNLTHGIERAKAIAVEKGWKWEEPIHISTWIWTWKCMTNANWIGGNIHFKIRKKDGELICIYYFKR
jgi:hypothetical protein